MIPSGLLPTVNFIIFHLFFASPYVCSMYMYTRRRDVGFRLRLSVYVIFWCWLLLNYYIFIYLFMFYSFSCKTDWTDDYYMFICINVFLRKRCVNKLKNFRISWTQYSCVFTANSRYLIGSHNGRHGMAWHIRAISTYSQTEYTWTYPFHKSAIICYASFMFMFYVEITLWLRILFIELTLNLFRLCFSYAANIILISISGWSRGWSRSHNGTGLH